MISYFTSPICSTTRFFMASFSGPIELPSPKICVVTPWRISPCERPSTSSDSVDHDSMLMKPGATARPDASMVRGGLGAAEIADAGDAIATDSDVGPPARRARAVEDGAAADHDVEHWWLLRGLPWLPLRRANQGSAPRIESVHGRSIGLTTAFVTRATVIPCLGIRASSTASGRRVRRVSYCTGRLRSARRRRHPEHQRGQALRARQRLAGSVHARLAAPTSRRRPQPTD